jgi:adenosylcobalamin-dependent ribonucleoside-triphosphate reductase
MSGHSFKLEGEFLDKYKQRRPAWGPLGYFVYKRTYARTLEDGTTEEFWQTCSRVVEGVYATQKNHCKHLLLPWCDKKAQSSAQEMYERMFSFKWLPPGRGLWAMGTKALEKVGGACLNNCAFTSTEDIGMGKFSEPFRFLMDMSMLGVGVGADTRGAGKVTLSTPVYSRDTYVVEDTREGWLNIVSTVIDSFTGDALLPLDIDYSQVRPKGSVLKTFGGRCSGYEPLEALVQGIIELLTPEEDKPYLLSSTLIVDLFNLIGKCVVSGGIRRTAEIMLGDPSDKEFLSLKDDQEKLMSHRWASNNSVFAEVGMDYTDLSQRIAEGSDIGLFWLDTARNNSRLIDPPDYKDSLVKGVNPCGEQSLESYELCCLVETFPSNHDTVEDYFCTLKYAYLYAKTVTLIPTHNERTNAVMMRNRRIGCSQSGIVQAIHKFGRAKYLEVCDRGYNRIQELDSIYSDWLCVPRSKKTTSVKPSGTVSLLAGTTPGIHYPHSEYYIRNVRVNEMSPLLSKVREAGFPVEKDKYTDNTYVVSFPMKEKYFQRSKEEVSMWEQVSNACALQKYWADNQVSITVTFKPEEKKDLKSVLECFDDSLKSISFLKSDPSTIYPQAVYIKITKEHYETLAEKINDLKYSDTTITHEHTDTFCDGDSCEISFRETSDR